MTSFNSKNFDFLCFDYPELYAICYDMENNFVKAPVSIYVYATRFLEYLLHDIAKKCKKVVNQDKSFADNINNFKMSGLNDNLAAHLISAYEFRNEIHKRDKSLKEDEKDAFELHRELFDIANLYCPNDYEIRNYTNPLSVDKPTKENSSIEETKKETKTVIRQKKLFNNCIICGSPNKASKSNFCKDCDKLLNYRSVLSKIIDERGKDSTISKYYFEDSSEKELMDYLISENILKNITDLYYLDKENLENFLNLTEEYTKIDEFLFDLKKDRIKNPTKSKFYANDKSHYGQVSKIIDEYSIDKQIKSLKQGYSLSSELKDWYDEKKSDFIEGNVDKKFVELNEVLIEEYFNLFEINGHDSEYDSFIDFWLEYFLDKFPQKYKKYKNMQKRLLLLNIQNLSFEESLEKSKLKISDLEKDKNNFLNGNRNDFYQKLIETLIIRYLNCRENGFSTDEICSELSIEKSEIELWLDNELFEEFKNRYSKIRLKLFEQSIKDNKSKEDILDDLEISEEELSEYIERGKDGDEEYVNYSNYFENEYYPMLIKLFLKEFREKRNFNQALKDSNLTEKDLKKYLYSNNEFKKDLVEIKIGIIVDYLFKKGKEKPNNNLLKKISVSHNKYKEWEWEINKELNKKRLNKCKCIKSEISKGKSVFDVANRFELSREVIFNWILKGSVDENDFNDLAFYYWENNISSINNCNLEYSRNVSIKHLRKNLDLKERYDFDYWKKWGLISKKYSEIKQEDIKIILEEYYHKNGD